MTKRYINEYDPFLEGTYKKVDSIDAQEAVVHLMDTYDKVRRGMWRGVMDTYDKVWRGVSRGLMDTYGEVWRGVSRGLMDTYGKV